MAGPDGFGKWPFRVFQENRRMTLEWVHASGACVRCQPRNNGESVCVMAAAHTDVVPVA